MGTRLVFVALWRMLRQTKVFSDQSSQAAGSVRMYIIVGIVFVVGLFFVMGSNNEPSFAHSKEVAKSMQPMTFSACRKEKIRTESGGSALLYEDKKLDEKSIVMIVGGRNGDLAHVRADRYGAKVFVFEGISARYAALESRFESVENVRVFPYYLSDEEKTMEWPIEASDVAGRRSRALLGIKDDSASSSGYGSSSGSGSDSSSGFSSSQSSGASSSGDSNWSGASGSSGLSSSSSGSETSTSLTEEVEFRSLKSVVQSNGFHTISLLHLDCNGCESDVLEFLVSHKNRVREIQFSYATGSHVDEPLASYCYLQKELATMFTLSFRYPYVFESWIRKA